MATDIKNFVNVYIDRNVQVTMDGSRPTAILYSAKKECLLVGSNSDYTKFYTNIENLTDAGLTDETDIQYAKIFFANGGCKLQMKTATLPTDLTTIDNQYVIIGSEATITDANLKKFNNLTGVNQKIFVNRITDTTITTKSSFIASKYSNVTGAEMAIAAYLTQIKFYAQGSPVDYDFTKENITAKDGSHDTLGSSITIADPDTVINLGYNFELPVADDYYNIGGNTTDGNDLVEQFGLIVMEQDLTTSVFKTLSSKVSDQKGIASVRTTMSEVLDKFVNSGFLITSQVWTGNDLVLPNKADTNKPNETVITKNTPISNGYYIHMFRLSSSMRKVYAAIIVATNKGIRYVEVNGKSI